MIRVAIIDDHPHVAIALRSLLEEAPDLELVAESQTGLGLPALIRRGHPDVLLLDVFMESEFDALAVVRQLRADFPALKICLLSAFIEPSLVQDFLKAGVHGYILKDDNYVSQIHSIIRDLAGGEIYLSPQAASALAQATRASGKEALLSNREIEVLRLAKRGLASPQIAQALHISPGTVRNHLSAIYRKLGVHTRYEALQAAEARKIL